MVDNSDIIYSEIIGNKEVFTKTDDRKFIYHTFESGKNVGKTDRYYGLIKSCKYCSNTFFALNRELKRDRAKFCCKKCSEEYVYEISKPMVDHSKIINGDEIFLTTDGTTFRERPAFHDGCNRANTMREYGVINTCPICNNDFFVPNLVVSRGHGTYCSNECKGVAFTGMNNTNWRGGTSFEDYPTEFNDNLKSSIRIRDHHKCRVCGTDTDYKILCVHHINYNKRNNCCDNLITLCSRCHGKTNFNRGYWQNYFKIMINEVDI